MPTHPRTTIARYSPILRLGCCICAIGCSFAASASEKSCAQSAAVVQVASGVYVRPGQAAVVFEGDRIANVGFVVGDRCVAVIDTGGSAAEGVALDCAIRKVTDRPVCYVINTHVHPDHLLGNLAFSRPGVEFVGHAKLPRALALRGDTYLERAAAYEGRTLDDSTIVFPQRTVTGTVQLDLGGTILSVRSHASAHTDHDLSVVVAGAKTAFLGDLVFLDYLPVIDGSINGWIGELETLSRESLHYVVPGHGPVHAAWPQAAAPTLEYLGELRREVRQWIASGGDIAAAQDKIVTSGLASWPLYDRHHRRNVAAAFAELEWED